MDYVFVFGSNLAGRHGAGAARFARDHCGAVTGVGVGRTGDSYALPTRGSNLEILPLEVIKEFIVDFIEYAKSNPNTKFKLTRIGCGLSGYRDSDIIPLFEGYLPSNVLIPYEWHGHFTNESWGSYDE